MKNLKFKIVNLEKKEAADETERKASTEAKAARKKTSGAEAEEKRLAAGGSLDTPQGLQ